MKRKLSQEDFRYMLNILFDIEEDKPVLPIVKNRCRKETLRV